MLKESIPAIDNVSPPIGISPIVRGSDFSVEEDEESESVSEWEIENRKAKV